MDMNTVLYQTTVSNQEGIKGLLHFSDNQELPTKHPLETGEGYNPEQLIASAWATCLNATIQSLLKTRGFHTASRVDITVNLCKETQGIGSYYFQVDAIAAIQDLHLVGSEAIVNEAHKRCPVSKLLSGSSTVTLSTVDYSNLVI